MSATTTEFEQPSATIRIPGGIVTIGGPILLMPVGLRRLVRFEMHSYCGPCPVTKTGSEMRSVPTGFWDAVDRWCAGGKRVNGDMCVVPQWCKRCHGEGNEIEPIGGRRFTATTCVMCQGKKVQVTDDK